MLDGDDVSRHTVDRSLFALAPCLIEVDSVDMLQDIDARWRLANLKDGMWVVSDLWNQPCNRCSVSCQRAVYSLAIFDLRADEKIEILRGPGLRVGADRVPSDDQVLNSVIVERE